MTKQDLFDLIIDILKNSELNFSGISKDGRVNSIIDEKIIINYLAKSEVNKYIVSDEDLKFHITERKVGDIYFKNPENMNEYIVVNIKSSSGKSADNVFSKIGLLIAFTDININDLPTTLSWTRLVELLSEKYNQVERDYYYLYVNKYDIKQCMIRGLKKISNFKVNPSNILQINWNEEYLSSENILNQDESYKNIMSLISQALKKDVEGKQKFIDMFI